MTKGYLSTINAQNFELSGTKSAVFSGNSSYARGVLAIAENGKATLSGNGSVSFDSNELRYSSSASTNIDGLGAAIYLDQGAELEVSGNADVSFSNHVVNNAGGAIYAINNYPSSINGTQNVEASITFQNNGRVSFANNKATYGYGGAIHGADITFDGQTEGVYFSDNSAQRGGAICISETGSLRFEGNETVEFTGNSTTKYDGGAIYAAWSWNKESGSIEFTGNETVTFSNNYASSNGGAVYAGSRNVTITGNTEVSFIGNGAGDNYNGNGTNTGGGGAIYGGSLNIFGNKSVTFRGNYQGTTASSGPVLRSLLITGNVNVEDDSFQLSAVEGGHITFYDSLYVKDMDTNISINGAAGSTGDVILSGRYVGRRFASTDARWHTYCRANRIL